MAELLSLLTIDAVRIAPIVAIGNKILPIEFIIIFHLLSVILSLLKSPILKVLQTSKDGAYPPSNSESCNSGGDA